MTRKPHIFPWHILQLPTASGRKRRLIYKLAPEAHWVFNELRRIRLLNLAKLTGWWIVLSPILFPFIFLDVVGDLLERIGDRMQRIGRRLLDLAPLVSPSWCALISVTDLEDEMLELVSVDEMADRIEAHTSVK